MKSRPKKAALFGAKPAEAKKTTDAAKASGRTVRQKRRAAVRCAALLCLTLCLLTAACTHGGTEGSRPVNTLRPTEVPGPTPVPRDTENDTTLSASMVYANNAANRISGVFDTGKRQNFLVKNLDSSAAVRLINPETKGLYSFTAANGTPYIEGGMTAYLTADDGTRYRTDLSPKNGRINMNDFGFYYYGVRIRDLAFLREGADYGVTKDTDITVRDMNALKANDLQSLAVKDGIVSAEVSGTRDPYLMMPVNAVIGNAGWIKVELAVTGTTSAASLYYRLGAQASFASERRLRFDVVPDGDFHTYMIPLAGEPLSGVLSAIRFDLDYAVLGDSFRIRAISLASADVSFAPPCGFEETLHTYSDKYHHELRLLYDETVQNLTEFGYEYKIPTASVTALQFETPRGTFSSLSDWDGSNPSYIVFDIRDAGVFGLILPENEETGVSLTEQDGFYVLRHFLKLSGTHRAGTDSVFGHRIYYSAAHTFDGAAREAYIERNPLTAQVEKINSHSHFSALAYDPIRGSYQFKVSGLEFSEAYYSRPNDYFGGTVTFEGDGRYDRTLYMQINSNSGRVEGSAILDDRKLLVPLPAQVSKNFVGEVEEPYYDPKDTAYSHTYYPIVVRKEARLTHTVLNLYQNWGANKLKQVSSISFIVPYYHLSTGVTESNCISPFYIHGRDGLVLPDFRGPSGIMWPTQPQFNSVGNLRFLSYKQKDGKPVLSEYTGSRVLSSGNAYADVEYRYRSDCSSIEYTLRHMEFPQDDENRTYYTMEIVFHRDLTVTDVRNNLTLFSFDGRNQFYRSLRYTKEDGSLSELRYDIGREQEAEILRLSRETPSFRFFDYDKDENGKDNDDRGNFAFLMKSCSVTLGGKAWDGNLVLRASTFRSEGLMLNLAELSLDLGDTDFQAGDRITLSFILLPFGTEKQENDDNAEKVYEDSIANPWRIKSAAVGTVVPENTYLPTLFCADNTAEFTVTGGRNANVVRIDGFTELGIPRLQKKEGDGWTDVDFAVEGYDGYQVNYTFDGNYSYSFVLYTEDPAREQTYRVTVKAPDAAASPTP